MQAALNPEASVLFADGVDTVSVAFLIMPPVVALLAGCSEPGGFCGALGVLWGAAGEAVVPQQNGEPPPVAVAGCM